MKLFLPAPLEAVIVAALFALVLAAVSETEAQDEQLTYCKNGKGEVVIVTNFTCPAGYWPI